MYRKHWFVILFFIAVIFGCNKDTIDVIKNFAGFEKPANFPQPVYDFSSNPVTKEGFELGRKLFYDPILSANNTISCGSCHIPTSAFTHHGHSVSHGIFDRLGTRNSPPIMNLAWSKAFMWDGGVFNLDLQPVVPITNHAEMDDSVSNVLNKLKNTSLYPPLFKKAFGTEEINSTRFLKALSQFMVMCVSNNAKYDSVRRGQASFTFIEQEGYALYQQKCSACHAEPLFTDNSYRNNGVEITSTDDKGRYNITLQETDKYKFKVPSLRNLSYTAPFMHNGNIYQLSGVFDHYEVLIQNTPNLDPLLMQNGRLGFRFTVDDRARLTAFLKTLDDKHFVTDPRLAEQ